MAVKDSYSKARAKKKSSSSVDIDSGLSKGQQKKVANKVKKSPIFILAVIFLVLGFAGGYFAFTKLSSFQMLDFKVNGVASEEVDYVIVDVSSIKENIETEGQEVSMEELFASIVLEDGKVECKFFGVDVSDTVSVKYYYREDISHEAKVIESFDLQTAGVYYIEYTSSHFAFKNATLIRTIIVTGVENDG